MDQKGLNRIEVNMTNLDWIGLKWTELKQSGQNGLNRTNNGPYRTDGNWIRPKCTQ